VSLAGNCHHKHHKILGTEYIEAFEMWHWRILLGICSGKKRRTVIMDMKVKGLKVKKELSATVKSLETGHTAMR